MGQKKLYAHFFSECSDVLVIYIANFVLHFENFSSKIKVFKNNKKKKSTFSKILYSILDSKMIETFLN